MFYFQFDANDTRFSALFTSHHYSVDPSDPHFKPNKAFDEIVNRKKFKSNSFEKEKTNSEDNQKSSKSDLKNLVESIKAKTKNNKRPKLT